MFFCKIIKIINDREYTINLWDTIGQEKYRALTKVFFKYSEIVIFVFDITNKKSFDALDYWYETIENELYFMHNSKSTTFLHFSSFFFS